MSSLRVCVTAGLGLLALAGPVGANPQDYCAAYARDFADQGPRNKEVWQKRFDSASADCLFAFTPLAEQPKPAGKKREKVETVKAEPKQVEPELAEPEKIVPENEEVLVVPDVPPPEEKPEKATRTKKTLRSIVAAAVEPEKKRPTKPNLKPGSQAWLDYCDKKYASFDRATGTYSSYSGVRRRCLVTAQ